MKFKVDENMPAEVASVLARAGYDAATVPMQGLSGAPDDRILAVCQTEERILVTLDQGFADITARPPEQTPGLIVLRLRSQAKEHVVDIIKRLVTLLPVEPLEHHLWVVNESSVRIRGNVDD